MKCFNHKEDAVGVCKHCYKTLCHDCLTVVHGVSCCKNSCESKVAELEEYLELSKQSIKKISSNSSTSGYLLLAIGIVFILIGLAPVFINNDYGLVTLAVFGFFALVGSVVSFRLGRRIKTIEKS